MERGTTQNHLNLSKASRFSVNSIQGPSLVMEMKKGESDNLEQKSKWRSWTRHYNPLILNFNVCSTVLVLGRCKLLSQFLHWPSLWFWRHRKGGGKGQCYSLAVPSSINSSEERRVRYWKKTARKNSFQVLLQLQLPKETHTWLKKKKKKKRPICNYFNKSWDMGYCFVYWDAANTSTAFSSFLHGEKKPKDCMISTAWCQSGASGTYC